VKDAFTLLSTSLREQSSDLEKAVPRQKGAGTSLRRLANSVAIAIMIATMTAIIMIPITATTITTMMTATRQNRIRPFSVSAAAGYGRGSTGRPWALL
jgi:hypothetical protein